MKHVARRSKARHAAQQSGDNLLHDAIRRRATHVKVEPHRREHAHTRQRVGRDVDDDARRNVRSRRSVESEFKRRDAERAHCKVLERSQRRKELK